MFSLSSRPAVYFHALYRITLHLKAALVDALYAKSLRLSAAARGERGVGAIVNLQSNDAAKLWNLPQCASCFTRNI
jgi:ATP-binding cassette subfamily C (CFTR/MRP) protein 1